MISDTLVQLLQRARRLLPEDEDAELRIVNFIGNGARGKPSFSAPDDYLDFIGIADGATLGVVTIVGSKFAQGNQMLVSLEREESTLSQEDWFLIGWIFESPLLLSRHNGEIWGFPGVRYEWWSSTSADFKQFARNLDEFMRSYVFGERYLEISDTSDQDPWWRFLQRVS